LRLLWQAAWRAFSRPGRKREEDRGEDGDDGDDDEELDEGETTAHHFASVGHSVTIISLVTLYRGRRGRQWATGLEREYLVPAHPSAQVNDDPESRRGEFREHQPQESRQQLLVDLVSAEVKHDRLDEPPQEDREPEV